ncbi:radical SAM protein [bacterium]|nr:radical SAM protein [bacterium]
MGNSLGIDLLPYSEKICSMNCVYCECGVTTTLTTLGNKENFPNTKEIRQKFHEKLAELKDAKIDVLTYAGHGEPTLHPNFFEVSELIFGLRNEFLPKVPIVLLTNATTVNEPKTRESYKFFDKVYFKLDAVTEELFRKINRSPSEVNLEKIILGIAGLEKKSLQVMFIRSEKIDNTAEAHVLKLLEVLEKIQPDEIQLYSLARLPAVEGVEQVSGEELNKIAQRISARLVKSLVQVF